jgi:hypothetical protein
MAEDYSTIQQHQPLRTPAGWDKQEKALIVQLDETFDDIYRRFGRLRMEDMGKKFRKQIADDEGNIAQMALDISGLTIEVGNKISKTTTYQTAESIVMAAENYTDANAYGKVSGITINSSGIDVVGSKYVKIRSGGTFEVDSTNFKIDSANKYLKTGNWKLADTGISYSSNELTGSYMSIDTSDDSTFGMKEYVLTLHSRYTQYSPDLTDVQFIFNYSGVFYGLLGGSSANTSLGSPGVPWGTVYANKIVGKIASKTTSQSDFNSITDQGTYWINSVTVNSHKPSTLPSTQDEMMLEVYSESIGSTLIYCVQRLFYSGKMYIRQYDNAYESWGSWYSFAGTAV